MTTEAFGDQGLRYADDPRLTGGQWPPASAPRAEPEPKPDPVEPEVAPQPAPVAHPSTGWVDDNLAGQLWYSAPQPAYPDLVRDARLGDWTLSDAARYGRLAWLWLPAMAARIGAWSILRVWAGQSAPRFAAEQPPIRGLIAQARESGRRDKVLCGLYLPARIASHVADYAGRTAIAVLLAWLTANALNGIPGIEVLIPDAISPLWWWDHVSMLAPNISSPNSAPEPAAPPASGERGNPVAEIVVFAVALLAGGITYWKKTRNKRPGDRGGRETT